MRRPLPALLLLVMWLSAAALPLAAADRLDRIAAALDRIEQRFWRAAGMSPDEAYYQETAELLNELELNGRDVQRVLTRARLDQMPNMSVPAAELRNLFQSVSRRLASSYHFRLKGTGMADYEKTFRRSRNSRSGKSRRDEPPPTLATVEPEAYSRWLAEVCDDNLSRFSRRKGERNAGLDDTLRETLAAYCSSIRTVRNALVTLRQQGQGLKF